MVVRLPCTHVKKQWETSETDFDSMLNENIDLAQKKRRWDCAFVEPTKKPSRRLMPDLPPDTGKTKQKATTLLKSFESDGKTQVSVTYVGKGKPPAPKVAISKPRQSLANVGPVPKLNHINWNGKSSKIRRDLGANVKKLESFIKKAKAKGADVREVVETLSTIKHAMKRYDKVKNGGAPENVLKAVIKISRSRIEDVLRKLGARELRMVASAKPAPKAAQATKKPLERPIGSSSATGKVWDMVKKLKLSKTTMKEVLGELHNSKSPFIVLDKARQMVYVKYPYYSTRYKFMIGVKQGNVVVIDPTTKKGFAVCKKESRTSSKKTIKRLLIDAYKKASTGLGLDYKAEMSLRISVNIKGGLAAIYFTGGSKDFVQDSEFRKNIAESLARYIFPSSKKGKAFEATITISGKKAVMKGF
jgi:hypothetical protein